ncbi:cell wall hydrolase [Thalassobacillus hwangdonensis]|uniref:Cell wall hydrolase n=1 Tax=Thalassobacillus hwangdonensis TaxID=546108 RepID=A0ABW3L2N4_9BACI
MIKKLFISTIALASAFAFSFNVDAHENERVHEVSKGESLYKIGQKYGVSVAHIKEVNSKSGNEIVPGETLTIPYSVTEQDKELLARLVEAEAKGESYAGKVAVATVVLNRVDSDLFPDSVKDVIYDGYQFSPVLNGSINDPASEDSKQAVNEALAYQGHDRGSLFFWNPDKASNAYLEGKEVTTIIDNHVFAR